VRSKEPAVVAAAVGAAPDRADDPHGEPLVVAGETATVVERVAHEPAPRIEVQQSPAAEPREPSPISEPTSPRAPTLRKRTAKLAHMAVTSARQRRAILAALLAVAALSTSVGILAGRWLAVRTAATGSTR
jgi:hypothetical protein